MNFEIKEDIAVPIDVLFAEVTDFTSFERTVLRRGGEVERIDQGAAHGIGSAWNLTFSFRGKPRNARAELAAFDRPNGYTAQSVSSGIEAMTVVDLVALSRSRTRLSLSITMSAKTLSARLLLQSMKLARGTLTSRLRHRVADFAKDVEERAQRTS